MTSLTRSYYSQSCRRKCTPSSGLEVNQFKTLVNYSITARIVLQTAHHINHQTVPCPPARLGMLHACADQVLGMLVVARGSCDDQ